MNPNNKSNIIIVLDNIRSVHNVGSVFRTAECLGVKKIYLCGTSPAPVDRFGRYREAMQKVALGAELLVSWESFMNTQECLKVIKTQNKKTTVVGIERTKEAQYINAVNWMGLQKNPVVLVFGNEVSGIESSLVDQCDVVVQLPQFGSKESFNVSVAAGIALGWIRYQTFDMM